ncbi:AzlC family ABC transporter permease, partial [Acidaminococcus intestini]|uniref:AzlC family ABC transporter permease n=2 Tax=Acidaminococcus intestini TaxID=187327 RepID=UPI003078139F
KPFLIYGMCDETFALIFAKKPHPDVDPGWFMLFVTLLDYTYWFTSAALGGIFGSLVPFDTKGIDFVMTSMFIVIFVEQVRQQKTPLTASIGLCSAVICRLLFGPNHFLIPTMIVILILVTGLRKRITQKGGFPS